jgi:hypothetical protein
MQGLGGMALILCAACSPLDNPAVADPASRLNENVFRCSVQPVLARSCSYNACHGITGTTGDGAALRVYSPGKLRAATPTTLADLVAPLTEAEQHANFESASAFSFGTAAVADNFLLRKPLPSGAGGYEHEGGAIYANVADKSYVAIELWLNGQGVCP